MEFSPAPCRSVHDRIVLGHGSGGKLSAELIEQIFLPAFSNSALNQLNDQAIVDFPGKQLAITTDSFVVKPLFFPGGDIGSLAVHGTVNDLAMGGAQPLYLSAAFILEEGLGDRRRCGAWCIAATRGHRCWSEHRYRRYEGRRKGSRRWVVHQHHRDRHSATRADAFCRPSGAGRSRDSQRTDRRSRHCDPRSARRAGVRDNDPERFRAPCIRWSRNVGCGSPGAIRCMRDPTRGGLSSALNEIAAKSRVGITLEERCVAVREEVRGACELLGLDPIYVANEGKLVAIVDPCAADAVLAAMHKHVYGREARIVGTVTESNPGTVVMRTVFGTTRIVDMLPGDQLPRIC